MRSGPAIILVRPQLAENIGAAARAMLNGGLTELRLVAPRDGWPQQQAWAMAAGAKEILEQARVYPCLRDAIADCHHVYGTCPRRRHMTKTVMVARGGAFESCYHEDRDLKVGILFGPERSGLTNEEASYADAMIRYPLNPAYNSLNLAQAVLVMAYEWWCANNALPPRKLVTHKSHLATRDALAAFLAYLERELVGCGFLRHEEKRATMVRNIRNFFVRGEITDQELQTFHGIVRELAHPHPAQKKMND